jgi:hypothetical protein
VIDPSAVRRARRSIGALLLVGALAAGCGEGPKSEPAPLDRFTWPTGLALVPAPAARDGRVLVVVSSNFDLRYSQDQGGSVLAVDPEAAGTGPFASAILGAVRIPSFGGEVGVVAGAPIPVPQGVTAPRASCPGWPASSTQVVVPSRSRNTLQRVSVDGAGALSCGAGCEVPLPATVGDPYGVAVVCAATENAVYVGHLRAPDAIGRLSKVDLATGGTSLLDLGNAPTSSLAFDADRQRLYVTTRFARLDQIWLHWLDPLAPITPSVNPGRVNLSPAFFGAELRSIALSGNGTRAYVAVRNFDRDAATDLSRPPELGSSLAVLDLGPPAGGTPSPTPLGLRGSLPLGANQVVVLPRPGLGGVPERSDLVALTSSEDGALTIFDTGSGAVVATLATDDQGRPLFGEQPFGLVAERVSKTIPQLGEGVVFDHRLYVGSFDRGFIRTVLVDEDAPGRVWLEWVFGPEMP